MVNCLGGLVLTSLVLGWFAFALMGLAVVGCGWLWVAVAWFALRGLDWWR